MLWHYQVVSAHQLPKMKSRWADGESPGQTYTPILLEIDHERLDSPYADEATFNDLAAPLRAAFGPVPLLVRVQYMNTCHVLNGAAAMALSRHAALSSQRWTIGGRLVRAIGWQWGNAPDGASLTVAQVGMPQRVKHQAHAHQIVTFLTEDGEQYVLDLSVAQFGDSASVQVCAGLVPRSAGCDLSATLRQRAADGVAPALFARSESAAAAGLRHCRVRRGPSAVEAALALVGSDGSSRQAGYALCDHVMPRPYFRPELPVGPQPDDDLVEGELLQQLSKFGRALLQRL